MFTKVDLSNYSQFVNSKIEYLLVMIKNYISKKVNIEPYLNMMKKYNEMKPPETMRSLDVDNNTSSLSLMDMEKMDEFLMDKFSKNNGLMNMEKMDEFAKNNGLMNMEKMDEFVKSNGLMNMGNMDQFMSSSLPNMDKMNEFLTSMSELEKMGNFGNLNQLRKRKKKVPNKPPKK